jgi:hypothetical protein
MPFSGDEERKNKGTRHQLKIKRNKCKALVPPGQDRIMPCLV